MFGNGAVCNGLARFRGTITKLTVFSMTGFARIQGTGAGFDWVWEVRSVNSRGLDLRLNFPPGLSRLEPQTREEITRNFSRGRFEISLALRSDSSLSRYGIDEKLLASLVARIEDAGGDTAAPSDIASLLTVRGVVVETSDERFADETLIQERDRRILDDLRRVIKDLVAARTGEGCRLEEAVIRHIDEIDRLARVAREALDASPVRIEDQICARLARLAEGSGEVSPERIAQEVAMNLVRGDVREEIDRIHAHIDAARDLLNAETAKGRRLEFLCQELNREAGTLCAKSLTLTLTRVGLDLKAAIDRLREQSQNIE